MFSKDIKTVKNRLNYCYDLINMKDRFNQGSTNDKDTIIFTKKIGSLRALIAGKELPKHELLLTSDSYADNYCSDLLSDYEGETDEAEKAKKLLKLKNHIDVQNAASKLDPTRTFVFRNESHQVEVQIAEKANLIAGLVNHTIENSKIKGMFDTHKAHALMSKEQSIVDAYNVQYKAAWTTLTEKHPEIRKPYNDYRDMVFAEMAEHGTTPEKREEIRSKHQEKLKALGDKSDEQYNQLKSSLLDDLEATYKADKEQIEAEKIAMAKAVKDAVFAQSTVTNEDAEKWITDKVTITKSVINKMKKNGITPEKFNQDLKDFFIITNGRLGKIKIDTKNHDRAYASSATKHEMEGFIMLDNRFEQNVLWHELAHHLEADDSLRLVAREYIKSRSLDGGVKHKLKDIYHKGFGSNEYAYKTDMFNHYAAKIYDHGTTEVFSMGVEALYDEATLFDVLCKDTKTLDFVTGALMQSKQEVDLINQKLRDGILDTNANAENGRTDMYQEVFKQLVGVVKFSESVAVTMDDLLEGDKETLEEWGAKFYGTLTLPNGKELILLKSSKVKYKSYRGRTMKGVYALDFKGYEGVKIRADGNPRIKHFVHGFDEVTFGIQTQDLDKVKVLALSMDLHRRAGYSIPDTKGNIGEGFLSFEKLDNLKKQYLQG